MQNQDNIQPELETVPSSADLPASGRLPEVQPNVEMVLQLAYGSIEACNPYLSQKPAQVSLQHQQEHLQMFMKYAPVEVAMFDREMRYLLVSDRWITNYRLTEQNIIGRAHYDIFPELPERWKVIHQRCLAGAIEKSEEEPFPRPDGSIDWVRWEIRPWYTNTNEIGGIIIFSEVITERKRLEEDLHQQAVELARKNRIKDEFLALLSHELRTPLTSILGWSTLLQKGTLNATKAAEALSIIERNAKLQVRLIEDLLDVSRILQGKLTLNITPVNLESKITAAIETVKLAAQAKAIQIQTQFEPNIGQVLGDGTRLQQVIWNLLSNAVKFTPSSGVIEVRLKRIGNYAQIEVTDTGKGIAPDFLPYVFEYFCQQDSTTTRQFGGLGLGLAIVRQIVELHGGTIAADSPGEEQGATFTVKFPISSTTLETIPNSSPTSNNLIDLKGLQILVVDDEPNSLDFVAFVLEQAGARVYKTYSAIAALKMLPHVKPNLVVSDIAMPEMDGYNFVRTMRSTHHISAIPAIALSAYVGEIDQQQAIAAGFQQHLSKPIEPAKLVQSVAQLLGKKVTV